MGPLGDGILTDYRLFFVVFLCNVLFGVYFKDVSKVDVYGCRTYTSE